MFENIVCIQLIFYRKSFFFVGEEQSNIAYIFWSLGSKVLADLTKLTVVRDRLINEILNAILSEHSLQCRLFLLNNSNQMELEFRNNRKYIKSMILRFLFSFFLSTRSKCGRPM